MYSVKFKMVKHSIFNLLSQKIIESRKNGSNIWQETTINYDGTDYIGIIAIECNNEKTFKEVLQMFTSIYCS